MHFLRRHCPARTENIPISELSVLQKKCAPKAAQSSLDLGRWSLDGSLKYLGKPRSQPLTGIESRYPTESQSKRRVKLHSSSTQWQLPSGLVPAMLALWDQHVKDKEGVQVMVV